MVRRPGDGVGGGGADDDDLFVGGAGEPNPRRGSVDIEDKVEVDAATFKQLILAEAPLAIEAVNTAKVALDKAQGEFNAAQATPANADRLEEARRQRDAALLAADAAIRGISKTVEDVGFHDLEDKLDNEAVEAAHAKSVRLRDFVDAVRRNPNAPVPVPAEPLVVDEPAAPLAAALANATAGYAAASNSNPSTQYVNATGGTSLTGQSRATSENKADRSIAEILEDFKRAIEDHQKEYSVDLKYELSEPKNNSFTVSKDGIELVTVKKNSNKSISYEFSENGLDASMADVILRASKDTVLVLHSSNYKHIDAILSAASDPHNQNKKIKFDASTEALVAKLTPAELALYPAIAARLGKENATKAAADAIKTLDVATKTAADTDAEKVAAIAEAKDAELAVTQATNKVTAAQVRVTEADRVLGTIPVPPAPVPGAMAAPVTEQKTKADEEKKKADEEKAAADVVQAAAVAAKAAAVAKVTEKTQAAAGAAAALVAAKAASEKAIAATEAAKTPKPPDPARPRPASL